jgi:dTMP kinase
MTTGKFITVEGVEGVGKSTNLELIASLVRERGYDVLQTREPGGTQTGERVREILLDKTEQNMTPMTELLLMFAARSQHVEEAIKPALQAGRWVISARFTDSSYAYQGAGRQLGEDVVAALESQVLGGFSPDLTIVLDIDVEAGLRRAARVGEADRFESEQREFFERVRQSFLDRAAKCPHHHVVDASQPIEAVQEQITKLLNGYMTS